jgi:hypothetical protein
MKSKLEYLRDLLAGRGDEAAAIRAELSEPDSECSLFMAGAAAVARDPLATTWPAGGEPDRPGSETEALLAASTPAPSGEGPTASAADWSAHWNLETTRDYLAGRAVPEAPGAGGGPGPVQAPATPSGGGEPMTTCDPRGPFPQSFGRYEVRAWLGGGGMGDVYRAHDRVLDVEVALKVPKAALAHEPLFREQFLHEARALARLDHPNICRIYDCGTVGPTPYLSMQLVRGDPLSRYRPAGQGWLEPADAVALAHTLALALAVAHGQGLIHRDLKPGNVLVKPEGQPILTDFGLALQLDRADALLPGPGQLQGTVPYMPPEQLDVRLAPLGPGCDVYALGVVLYELLTGRRPYSGPSPGALLRQILGGPPTPPSEMRAGVPAALDPICLRALAAEVRDRFVSMEEFAEALAHSLADLSPGSPGRPSAGARPRVDRQAIRFTFAGYGTAAPPSASFRDRLYLDVGNDLRAGVLDHHQLVMSTASSTGLVLNRPDLIDAILAPGRREGDAFTVVTHEHPDLDAAAAAFLAVEYLATGRYPPGADLLARYVDRVDEGYPGMSLDQPFTLYAAYQVLANRPPTDPSGVGVQQWRQALTDGLRLIGHVVEQAERTSTSLEEVDAFACPGLFAEGDREAVRADIRRYERKLADPRCRARAAVLRLPGRFGGREKAEALLVRDVQNADDPECCLFFKDWARTDARRSGNGKGFVGLCVFMSESGKQRRRCILSVTPDSRVSLRGLGARLDQAESERRRQLHGEDDRVRDPVTGALKPSRPGYTNADPWYDGRAHGYTIVDAPREGTVLTADEVEAVFLDFGGCTEPLSGIR